MPSFESLEIKRGRRSIDVTGRYCGTSTEVPVSFFLSIMKSWIVAETAGSIDGKRFMDFVAGILGNPVESPTLVKGSACDEGEGEDATGATFTATWEFSADKMSEVLVLLSKELGIAIEEG